MVDSAGRSGEFPTGPPSSFPGSAGVGHSVKVLELMAKRYETHPAYRGGQWTVML